MTIIPILGKTPKFVDLRLLTVNTADEINSVFTTVTRAEGLMDHSNWFTYRHHIAEVTADRVREAKAYSDYIKNHEFETMNIFEQEDNSGIRLTENNSGTRLNENIQMTQPDQNIPLTRLNQNIPMTQLNENISKT